MATIEKKPPAVIDAENRIRRNYLNKSHKILKIPKNDAYKLYLSYYLGWSDYKNYSKDKKAIIYAKSVKDIASKYRKQLTTCRDQLNRKKYIIY